VDLRKALFYRYQNAKTAIRSSLRWLIPGIGIKRWFLLILLGITLIGIGIGVIILEIYRTAPDAWWLPILSYSSLRFLARPLRAIIFGGIGIGLILWGIRGFNRSLMSPFVPPGRKVIDRLWTHRQRERGPRIVAIGGGHGLAAVLRGLKSLTYNLSAVVSVADDGGSSGRLRRDTGILPPGDIRNCLVALSDDEALLGQLFQYRFPNGSTGLDGHSFGNLFISALADITGSFEQAVAESGQVLAVHGRVVPSTLHDVTLVADVRLPNLVGEVRVAGESSIPVSTGRIRRVWLEPDNPPAFPLAIQTILTAEVIVIGPGSLYTSILPNLLVPDIAEAIRASRGLKIYVCNMATQPGETDGYICLDHVLALEDHAGSGLFDIVLVNKNCSSELPEGVEWVTAGEDMDDLYNVYRADLTENTHPIYHDSQKLAKAIKDLYQQRTGPLVE
jgi:uncharacterized cofD-like protein